MQIFSLFDAQMRGVMPSHKPSHKPSPELRIGFQLRLIPPAAGLGNTCDYVFLRAGESQPALVVSRAEWWACLRGGLRVSEGDREVALLGGGDIFVPEPGRTLELQVLLDCMLVRVVHERPVAVAEGAADCAMIDAGDSGWGRRMGARDMRWAVCYRGTLCLQWRTRRPDVETQAVYLQPGMAFAPDAHDVYTVDPVVPGGGLLCCVPPDAVRGDVAMAGADGDIAPALIRGWPAAQVLVPGEGGIRTGEAA